MGSRSCSFQMPSYPLIAQKISSQIFFRQGIQDEFGLSYSQSKSSAYQYILKFLTGTFLSSDIASDILITVSMCYYLHRSRTGLKRYIFYGQECYDLIDTHSTNTMINLLITYAIRTCLLTTCVFLLILTMCSNSQRRICTFSCLVTVSQISSIRSRVILTPEP